MTHRHLYVTLTTCTKCLALSGVVRSYRVLSQQYVQDCQFHLIKIFLFFCNLTFKNMMSIVVPLYYTDLQSLVPIEHSPSEEFVQEEIAGLLKLL